MILKIKEPQEYGGWTIFDNLREVRYSFTEKVFKLMHDDLSIKANQKVPARAILEIYETANTRHDNDKLITNANIFSINIDFNNKIRILDRDDLFYCICITALDDVVNEFKTFVFNTRAYLLNDNSKTIEKLN